MSKFPNSYLIPFPYSVPGEYRHRFGFRAGGSYAEIRIYGKSELSYAELRACGDNCQIGIVDWMQESVNWIRHDLGVDHQPF
jgi:hypothetical protein